MLRYQLLQLLVIAGVVVGVFATLRFHLVHIIIVIEHAPGVAVPVGGAVRDGGRLMPADRVTVMRQALHTNASRIARLKADLRILHDGDRARSRTVTSVQEPGPVVITDLQVLHRNICQPVLQVRAILMPLLSLELVLLGIRGIDEGNLRLCTFSQHLLRLHRLVPARLMAWMLVGHLLRVKNLLRLHGAADLRQRYFMQGGGAGRADEVLLLQVENRARYVAMACDV